MTSAAYNWMEYEQHRYTRPDWRRLTFRQRREAIAVWRLFPKPKPAKWMLTGHEVTHRIGPGHYGVRMMYERAD